MKQLTFFTLSLVFSVVVYAQSPEERIEAFEAQIAQLDEQKKGLLGQVEEIKLEMVRRDLKAIGLPAETYIEHSAMMLEYDEQGRGVWTDKPATMPADMTSYA